MRSDATNPDDYYAALPDDRAPAMRRLRAEVNACLPTGFAETMAYGMPAWVVPHSLYPAGYHCNPKEPLPFMSMASQKQYISVYHMGLYTGTGLLDWFTASWSKFSDRKLDMGKCCVRFKKPEQIPFELIGELASRITPAAWITTYEESLGSERLKGKKA